MPPVVFISGSTAGDTVKQTWLPGLNNTYQAKIVGALLIPGDSSGDCRQFTISVADLALNDMKNPIHIKYNSNVKKVKHKRGYRNWRGVFCGQIFVYNRDEC